jgi:hypothetical protein
MIRQRSKITLTVTIVATLVLVALVFSVRSTRIFHARVAGPGATANHGILFSWTPSESAGITTQRLYCGTQSGGEDYTNPVATFPASTTQYLFQGGAVGETYYCTVTALIGASESKPSNEASAIFPSSTVTKAFITPHSHLKEQQAAGN